MSETILENISEINLNAGQLEPRNIVNTYQNLPPCVQKDIDQKLKRRNLKFEDEEGIKIVHKCNEQYLRKREYSRKLGKKNREMLKQLKNINKQAEDDGGAKPPVAFHANEGNAQGREVAEEVPDDGGAVDAQGREVAEEDGDDLQAEEKVYFDKLHEKVTATPEKKIQQVTRGVPRTQSRVSARGVTSLFA